MLRGLKHVSRAAAVGMWLVLAVCALPAGAQEATPPVEAVPAVPAPNAPVVPVPLMAAPKTDLALLRRALSTLVNSPVADCVSDMDITAAKLGARFHLREHLKITARRPSRFVSAVTLAGQPPSKPTHFTVVSDGLKVLTYQPGTSQYAIVPITQFQAGDDAFPALGLTVGLLYLGNPAFVRNLDMLAKDDTGVGTASLRPLGMALTSKPAVVGGVSLIMYTLQIGKQGAYRFYVDPANGQMARVELRTMQDGVSIRMIEKIVSFNPLLSAPAKTFQLAPPIEAQRVPALPVGYF